MPIIKSTLLLLSLLTVSSCIAQPTLDSIQKDVHLSIEKIVYNTSEEKINASCFFLIFISVDKKEKNILFLSTDTNYTHLFIEIETELRKKRFLNSHIKKGEFLFPVFFISLDDKNNKPIEINFRLLAEKFPVDFKKVTLMRRIVLFSTEKVK